METFVEIKCHDCGYTGTSPIWVGTCPRCNSHNIEQNVRIGILKVDTKYDMPYIY